MKSKYFKIRHLLAVLGIGFIVISTWSTRHEGSNINGVNLEILNISLASAVEFKVTQVGKAIELHHRLNI